MKRYLYKLGKRILSKNMKRRFRGGGIKGILGIKEKKINIGFIGTGRHAFENIYPSLRYANINLKAVCATSLDSAKKAKIFGAEKFYDDYKEMFKQEELDAVFVVVNRKKHKQICIDAMSNGLDVFVEKPPGDNLEEIKELVDVSKGTNRLLMVGFQKRFAPGYVKIKEEIDKGLNFDKVKAFFRPGKVEDMEELIKEVGIHHIDLMKFFFRELGKISIIEKGKDSILFSIALKDKKAEIYFSGEEWNKNSEEVKFYSNDKEILSLHNLMNLYKEDELIWEPNFSIPINENQTFFLNGFAYEIRHFVDCILKKTKCKSDIKESLDTYRIINEIL